jgi:acetoin utilization deacetylase AcuC-like enzyme/nucleotide-binding universal stress UspA family protein
MCATDFSEQSAFAIRYSVYLTKKFNARLFIFHTVYSPQDGIYGTTLFEYGGEREKRTLHATEMISRLMQNYSVCWEPIVVSEEPVEGFLRTTETRPMDLVVVTSYSLSKIKRLVVGTIVERLVQTITCPLLIVHPVEGAGEIADHDAFLKKMVVCCNLSSDLKVLMRFGISLALKFAASLYFLHSIETPVDETLMESTQGPYIEVQQAYTRRLKARLLQQIPESMRDRYEPNTILLPGIPGEVIPLYAEKADADLIIMGIGRAGAMKKMFIGSTVKAVLRQAQCPVLFIPSGLANGAVSRILNDTLVSKTGIVRDDQYLKHLTGEGHPETSRRLQAIYAMIDETAIINDLTRIPSRPASEQELLYVHSSEYIKKIAATQHKEYCTLTPDTFACAHSYEAALWAVGGLLSAISRVVAGDLRNAFALVRPPGHHAEPNRAMGFCLFNNIAIGAKFAREKLRLKRVLIVDWDVHHGNGTQHAFEQDDSILFFSVHQNSRFPGTGHFTEVGRGKGEGFTFNIPLPAGYGDGEYAALFKELLFPVALEFAPELILVSAGFDTGRSDRMGSMKMTQQGFAGLTRCLMNIADRCCDGKIVLTLEGGYHLKELAASVQAVLCELTDLTMTSVSEMAAKARRKKVNYAIKRCVHVHRHFWSSLQDGYN